MDRHRHGGNLPSDLGPLQVPRTSTRGPRARPRSSAFVIGKASGAEARGRQPPFAKDGVKEPLPAWDRLARPRDPNPKNPSQTSRSEGRDPGDDSRGETEHTHVEDASASRGFPRVPRGGEFTSERGRRVVPAVRGVLSGHGEGAAGLPRERVSPGRGVGLFPSGPATLASLEAANPRRGP